MTTPLLQISSLAFEHPADRAALQTLRAVPGVDDVVRRVASLFTERTLRHLFTANAVRVGPTQFPALDAQLTEVLTTLDWSPRPQLYVSQSHEARSFAVGFRDPFIVMTSRTLELLNADERRFVLAHEVAHIMSGHMTYRTLAVILLLAGRANLPVLAGLALLPIRVALLEWFRMSELSADRGGLLGTQAVRVAQTTLMKLAGGDGAGDAMDLDAFLAQAREYDMDETAWDTVLKVVNTALREHPFATVRAAELDRFVASDAYTRIVDGDYPRRGAEGARPLGEDIRDAADYYSGKMRQTATTVSDSVARARDAFTEAFRGKTES